MSRRNNNRKSQDALAAEGYRLLDSDTGRFAEMVFPLAAEVLSGWELGTDEDKNPLSEMAANPEIQRERKAHNGR